MKIIAIDSSGLVATVAIASEDALIAEYTVNYKKTHSQTLLPMLNEISQMTELDLAQVDAIAVASGPGSFTGLRIGSATAKGLGLAICKEIISQMDGKITIKSKEGEGTIVWVSVPCKLIEIDRK